MRWNEGDQGIKGFKGWAAKDTHGRSARGNDAKCA